MSAWIQSHQSLRDHPKTRRLARRDAYHRQAATEWRELATAAEAARAPRYLTWAGRRLA